MLRVRKKRNLNEKPPHEAGGRAEEGANFRGEAEERGLLNQNIYYILHTRKPFILSSMDIFTITSSFNRFAISNTCFLAEMQSRQGIKNDVPALKFFQLIS